ncbi:MAG: cytochrome C oxidase subunit II [Armatimonadetes bacterium]|nr:cytochrome C oxidase subunit II [Armatimonadota bacterium]
MDSPIYPIRGVWWKPAGAQEKQWVTIAFVWCMILFAMMPFWHLKGGQNPSGIRSRVEPKQFNQRVQEFIKEYQVGQEKGIPVVAPPAGSEIYLMGQMWRWTPILKLERGASYTLHLSSFDVNHGFSLYPMNINFQVVPGYDYGLKVTPNEAGEFRIICNEFCGIGHHTMIGKMVVVEGTP